MQVLVLGVVIVLCLLAVVEPSIQRLAARGLVKVAGVINRSRRAEFAGELAMIQTATTSSGVDYAVGAVLGATVETATRRKPLRITNVTKRFGDFDAISGVSLDIPAGTITALLGGNGAGKTTLLNLLAGVHQRDGGTIYFDGMNIDEPGARDDIAFIPQDFGLVENMTVAQNLTLFGDQGWIVRPHVEHALSLIHI